MKKQSFPFLEKICLEHGGEKRKHKRKIARPISTKDALHVVIRSTRAKNQWSLLHPRHVKRIKELIKEASDRFQIRIYQFAIVGNHIHLLIRGKMRLYIQNFLKFLPGSIAMIVTGAKKGNKVGRFWNYLAYSRVVSFNKGFKIVSSYILKNEKEGKFIERLM